MQLTPLDQDKRLWAVTDVLPVNQFDKVLAVDWLNVPWTRESLQESWPRRKIEADATPEVKAVSRYIDNVIEQISKTVNVNYYLSGHWWLDEPGFQCALHTDGELLYSAQMYWIVPGDEWGTTFYNFKDVSTVKKKFSSIPNTGYVMMNHPDSDGSQPLQWHAMLNPVPDGCYRLTSYWFGHR